MTKRWRDEGYKIESHRRDRALARTADGEVAARAVFVFMGHDRLLPSQVNVGLDSDSELGNAAFFVEQKHVAPITRSAARRRKR